MHGTAETQFLPTTQPSTEIECRALDAAAPNNAVVRVHQAMDTGSPEEGAVTGCSFFLLLLTRVEEEAEYGRKRSSAALRR